MQLKLKSLAGLASEDFSEFAKNCVIFIFTCFPVQGDEPSLWDFRENFRMLNDVLKHKIIFSDDPRALLEVPVFRQDKVQLYELLREYMTPTLIISRPQPGSTFDETTNQQIYNFDKKYLIYEPRKMMSKIIIVTFVI